SLPTDAIPGEWTDPAYGDVCDATSDAGFVQPSNGGACQQNWIATTTENGTQECVRTVPSFKSFCPIGFALDGGLCEYQPQDSADWQVGFCRSFKSYEVPIEWIKRDVCKIDPVPNPGVDPENPGAFLQAPAGDGSCPENWIMMTSRTGEQECALTVPTFKSSCPVGFSLNSGLCAYQPPNSGGWQVGFCRSFNSSEVPPEWIKGRVCEANPDPPDPEQTFVKEPNQGACQQNWTKILTQTAQQECVLTIPIFKSTCPIGFAIKDSRCQYVPQHTGIWQVGFCTSFSSDEVPPEWIKSHVCDIDPIPNPETKFVAQPAANGSCQQNWVSTLTATGQQECILTVPASRGACPIGFTLDGSTCNYVSQDQSHWQVGFCHTFSNDEIPPEWTNNHVCDTNPVPDPEQTFIKPGPCQQGWIGITAETTQQQCLLTIPAVRGLCPAGFALDGARCDYVPQSKTTWTVGFCKSFSSDEIPPTWISNHVCDINPIPDPEQTFIKPVPCQANWIETTNATGQVQCILTVPDLRGLCPQGFALDGAKCDYVPKSTVTWVAGFCKSFSSDEVPPEWMSMHVCDTNPVPNPEQTFIKAGPCVQNWIRTSVEGGATPKCALTVPAIRELCPIGFALDGASCDYVPQNITGWRFPCSDLPNGTPNENAITNDWLSGNSPDTQTISSDPTVTDGVTGGRFEHTFAADTYGLKSVQDVFGPMLALAFVLVTPMLILIGYQIMLAASSFRHAGALEGLSRVFLGVIAVGISFQLVTMLISMANTVSGAIVGLHGMLGYIPTQTYGLRAAYTLAGVSEPLTSYRGLVMPMSRWGCAVNDFIGILGNQFFSHQVTTWLPVIGNLAPLATQVTNGAQLASRLTEFARMALSVVLWLQAVIRIGLLNCYILTCPLALACWALPGELGQQVVRQWTKGFLAVLFIQVGQLFLITTLPLILPSFPAVAGDNGIIQVLLTQIPPLLVLWLTVSIPKFVGIGAARAIGMTGVMAGGIVGTVGAAASLLR
ncbi:MAG TPA: MFS transporter, partial [Ktedonobacteraceae bacterium]